MINNLYGNLFTDEKGEPKTFSISEISNILKQTVEAGFSKIRIRGEITGLKKHQSGHLFLLLRESLCLMQVQLTFKTLNFLCQMSQVLLLKYVSTLV